MKWKLSLVLTTLLFLALSSLALAHGVVISYEATENGEIELQAVFDTGEVMSEAQVSIFSPADPATPWLTGTADEAGRFTFTPDQPGTWDVQFRKAGHGDIVHIIIEEVTQTEVAQESQPRSQRLVVANSGSDGLTTPQILLMSGSVIWGFIGTALFFARGRNS